MPTSQADPTTARKAAPSRSWLRLDALLAQNPKVADLSDAEFRAWILTLCAAKLAQSEGEWPDDRYYRQAVGRDQAAHLEALVSAGLIDRDDDGIHVHDWNEWQPKDETAAERSKRYRERRKAREAVTCVVTPATRDDTQTRRDVTRRDVTSDTDTSTSSKAPAAIGARRTDQFEPMWGTEWQTFLEAWEERGFRFPPTPRQREALWPIADARPTDLGRWVASAPRALDASGVVGYCLDRWRDIRSGAA